MSKVALILAGGSGERFWPASTPTKPKQLLHLHDPDRSLLQQAVDRLQPLFAPEEIFVVTGPAIAGPIRESGIVPFGNVIEEPSPRNTLPALCWATAKLRELGYEDKTAVAIVTADHAIKPEAKFRETIQLALSTATRTSGLVTIGIRPTRAETGFGYIESGESDADAFRVKSFHEKPDLATAKVYSSDSAFFWNSGMFFWTIAAFERELVSAANINLPLQSADPNRFQDLEKLSVDKGLMEKSPSIFVVPALFEWDDLGSWDALGRSAEKDVNGNIVSGEVKLVEVQNSIIQAGFGFKVGIVGLDNVVVVATENGVLVCSKDSAQRVREVKF